MTAWKTIPSSKDGQEKTTKVEKKEYEELPHSDEVPDGCHPDAHKLMEKGYRYTKNRMLKLLYISLIFAVHAGVFLLI